MDKIKNCLATVKNNSNLKLYIFVCKITLARDAASFTKECTRQWVSQPGNSSIDIGL